MKTKPEFKYILRIGAEEFAGNIEIEVSICKGISIWTNTVQETCEIFDRLLEFYPKLVRKKHWWNRKEGR
jgi:hypothetical protein